jgi:RNA polymerase sigma-70 factor (sigma-E family)
MVRPVHVRADRTDRERDVRSTAPDDFETLYRRCYPGLVRLAFVTTGSLALSEELVQDAFVALYRRRAQVHSPEAWLRTAVVHAGTSWLRRLMLERRHPPEAPEAHLDTSARDFLAQLARLTPRQRAAVFLRYHDGCSENEIAEALGCRPGTVKSLLHRALASLRKEFSSDD